jgi:hypothetical protein
MCEIDFYLHWIEVRFLNSRWQFPWACLTFTSCDIPDVYFMFFMLWLELKWLMISTLFWVSHYAIRPIHFIVIFMLLTFDIVMAVSYTNVTIRRIQWAACSVLVINITKEEGAILCPARVTVHRINDNWRICRTKWTTRLQCSIET